MIAAAPLDPPARLAGLILFGQGVYIHAKALLAQVLLERAFTETVATGRDDKPWSWADTWPVARIEVKRIDASAIVLAGSSGQALAFGPGHVELTPDAGERGVAVYSAHRDTHFRFLRDVAIGDEIDVTRRDGKTFRYRADRDVGGALRRIRHRSPHRRIRTGADDLPSQRCRHRRRDRRHSSDGREFRYRADSTSVVRYDASGIDPCRADTAVLSTCWPFDALTPGPERYLLHTTMIGPAP